MLKTIKLISKLKMFKLFINLKTFTYLWLQHITIPGPPNKEIKADLTVSQFEYLESFQSARIALCWKQFVTAIFYKSLILCIYLFYKFCVWLYGWMDFKTAGSKLMKFHMVNQIVLSLYMYNLLNQPEYIVKQSRLGMLIININEFYILNGAELMIISIQVNWIIYKNHRVNIYTLTER